MIFIKKNHERHMIRIKKRLSMKIYYKDKLRAHLVTIVSMTPFTLKLTSKLRSALHLRYLTVIPRFIPRANGAQF